ncbi:MAG: hypothetical protein HZB25_00350 [Candidatus Eisenbacteria bacterium]|nr:hypothetical protein [Candidatus Eisenbacteria bacterium]
MIQSWHKFPAFLALLACLAAPVGAAQELTPIRSDAAGFEFVYRVPGLSLAPDTVGGRVFLRPVVPGAVNVGEVGAPSLPVRTVLVGVPFGARVEVDVETAGAVRQRAGVPSPQPRLASRGDARGTLQPEWIKEAGPQAYARASFEPQVAGRLAGFFILRNQRLARIELYPVQAAPGLGAMRALDELRVRVRWSGGRTGSPADPADPFETMYRRRVLNYEAARAFRRAAGPRMDNPLDGPAFFSASTGPWLRMRLTRRGIYEVGQADLQAAGLQAPEIASLDPTTVRVFTGAEAGIPLPEDQDCDSCFMAEVDCETRDAADAPITVSRGFQVGDKVVFYATATQGFPEEFHADTTASDSTSEYLRNEFTDENVYWLTWGAGSRFPDPPRRMTRVASLGAAQVAATFDRVPARLHFEEDNSSLYYPDVYSTSETFQRWEKWWWEKYTNESPGFLLPAEPFVLLDADTSADAQVRMRLWGSPYAGYYHNAELGDANRGTRIGTALWYNNLLNDLFGKFHPSAPTNQFTIRVTTAAPFKDEILLGYFDVLYRRLLKAQQGALFFRAPDSVGALGYSMQGFSGSREVYSIGNFASVRRITGGEAGFFAEAAGGRRAYQVVEPGARMHPARIERAAYLGRSVSGGAYLKDLARGADDIIVSYDGFLQYAEELGAWRRGHLQGFASPRVAVTGIQQVYDEFSGGRFDPTALRNFARYAFRNWSGSPLSYLTLLGDASNDFKNRAHRAPNADGVTNFVPMYENSFQTGDFIQYGTDDWFADVLSDQSLAFAVGRLPAANAEQARMLVREKTIAYEQAPELGTWRNRVLLGADDLYLCAQVDNIGYKHTQQSEEMARSFFPAALDMVRVYLLEYPYGATGDLCNKPGAERSYVESMNEGALVVTYVGHGNPIQIGNEKLFSVADLGSVHNGKRLWWFLVASCTVGKVDAFDQDGLAESLIKIKGGGAMTAFAATQLAVSDYSVPMEDSIIVSLFDTRDGRLGHPVGLAVVEGKTNFPAHFNNSKYVLQGDPALVLGAPRHEVRLDALPDTLRQGERVTVPLTVYRGWGSSEVNTDFNGTDSIEVSEPPIVRKIDPLSPFAVADYLPLDYRLPSGTIFRGAGTIRNGRGSVTFWMPASAKRGANARIRVYGHGFEAGGLVADASGSDSFTVLTGTAADDDSGPSLSVTLEGGLKDVQPGAVVHIQASSPHGIYLGQQPLNSVYLSVDNGRRVILNERFTYNLDSYTEGTVDYALPALEPGAHTLLVSAASNQAAAIESGRHRKTVTLTFTVAGGVPLEIRNLFNYPNPVRSGGATDVYFEYGDAGDAVLNFLTVSGRRIRTLRGAMVPGRNRFSWDLKDEDGDRVANGTYLVQVETRDSGGQLSKAIGKIVVLGN